MSRPVLVELSSDDDDDNHGYNNTNNAFATSTSNHLKRPRTTEFPPNSTSFFIIDNNDDDDDPPPPKLRTSASSARSSISEFCFSESPTIQDPLPLTCESNNVKDPSSISPSLPRKSTAGGLICLESDDEGEECMEQGIQWRNSGTFAGFDEGKDLETNPVFAMRDKLQQNGEISAVSNSDEECNLGRSSGYSDSIDCTDNVVRFNACPEGEGSLAGSTRLGNGGRFSDLNVKDDVAKKPNIVDFDVECVEDSPVIVKPTCLVNRKSAKTYAGVYLEDDADQVLLFHDPDHGKENARLEADGANCELKSRSNCSSPLKQNRNEKLMNRKKSQEEKTRLMEEKKLKKQQDQLHKAALKAEVAKSKQLEKDRQRWEKECEKNILTEIDPKVLQCGSIGGHLLTRFGEKGLRFNITSNPIEQSIVWRMSIPDELSQLSSLGTDIRYVLLIYDAEEFCKVALDGSIMDHIASVRNRYPSYTICCLTNRLMSYINKREQDKYRNRKNGSDWERPPVEEVFAKLTTHFAKVHARQCADEAELADHVVRLTISLAKCRFRKKLTAIFVNANECNVPKDSVDRDLILKNPWLKMLVAIPKVQPRFAIAIWKKYPTMKSLLSAYMDPTKSVREKEFLLKDLVTEGTLGNEDRRVGEICSKRVYRIFMARNGSITTDEVEDGADYFTTNLNSVRYGEEQVIPGSVHVVCESPIRF